MIFQKAGFIPGFQRVELFPSRPTIPNTAGWITDSLPALCLPLTQLSSPLNTYLYRCISKQDDVPSFGTLCISKGTGGGAFPPPPQRLHAALCFHMAMWKEDSRAGGVVLQLYISSLKPGMPCCRLPLLHSVCSCLCVSVCLFLPSLFPSPPCPEPSLPPNHKHHFWITQRQAKSHMICLLRPSHLSIGMDDNLRRFPITSWTAFWDWPLAAVFE